MSEEEYWKTKYSIRSIQKIVDKSAKLAKIKRKIHPHTLRHSFATHLIENGYDVTNVQALLGHKSPETMLIYTHIASPNLINTQSPLESLQIKNHLNSFVFFLQ